MCGESPQEVPLCGTGRHGFAVQNVPHIFFLSCQKENVPDTVQKKNRLQDELTHLCQLTHAEERPVRTAHQIRNNPTSCAESPRISEVRPRICRCGGNWDAGTDLIPHSFPRFQLR